jgi:hypothetical protein
VVPLSPAIAIPVVASVAINGERSALVEQFVKTCQETMQGNRIKRPAFQALEPDSVHRIRP